MTTAEIFEAGRAWMRKSLAERPADPEQQRRVRILLKPRQKRRVA